MTPKSAKQHEREYWHIRKFKILPIIATLFFSTLAYFNLYLIDWDIIKIVFECDRSNCNLIWNNLIVCYPLIFEYVFIALTLISITAIIKGGFKNLKKYNKGGLISGLISGLIFGLISGLIFGLIFGLISGLISSLISSLIFSLIFGLISGLNEEFK